MSKKPAQETTGDELNWTDTILPDQRVIPAREYSIKRSRDAALKWDRQAKREGYRQKVVLMHGDDWLTQDYGVLAKLVLMIRKTSSLDWLLTTGNPYNFVPEMIAASVENKLAKQEINQWLDFDPPANAWVGLRVTCQKDYDDKIQDFTKIPAVLRYLLLTDLKEPVEVDFYQNSVSTVESESIKWVVVDSPKGNCKISAPANTFLFVGHGYTKEIPS